MSRIELKTFDDLTPAQRSIAVTKRVNLLLNWMSEGVPLFDAGSREDKLVQEACDEAERMQTPWFVHEYIMDKLGDELREMAIADCREMWYIPAGLMTMIEPEEKS